MNQTRNGAYPMQIHPNLHSIPPGILRDLPTSAISVARELMNIISISKRKPGGMPTCYPSRDYLSAKTGFSLRTISRAIKRLKEAGVIDYIHRRWSKTRKWMTNLYFIGSAVIGFIKDLKNHVKNLFSRGTSLANKGVEVNRDKDKTVFIPSLRPIKFLSATPKVDFDKRRAFLLAQAERIKAQMSQ